MKSPSRKTLSVGFGVASVLLVTLGWMFYRTTTRLIEDTAWVTHTRRSEKATELPNMTAEMAERKRAKGE